MTQAHTDKLVERIVTSPKGFHAIHPVTGERFHAQQGDKVHVTLRAATNFSVYLVAPAVARAQAEAAVATAEAEKAEAEALADVAKAEAENASVESADAEDESAPKVDAEGLTTGNDGTSAPDKPSTKPAPGQPPAKKSGD